MNLKELKKAYEILQEKHKLPSFSELNENFEIEQIRKGEETLLRTIRKAMINKVANSMNFLEIILNPMNAPRLYLVYIKSITQEDKKEIEKLYSALSDLAIGSLKLEIDYSENEEAEMIKKIFKEWNSVKPEFRKMIVNMQKPASSIGKEKSYFG
jgi:hypothetical protein